MAVPGSPPPSPADSAGSDNCSAQTPVVGRFAPSPSGPLHQGSLLAAVASYLEARSQKGRWLLRMEDLDPPREQAGAADTILHQLDTLGLHWDNSVLYQSTRLDAYREALLRLEALELIYYCNCSRQQLRQYKGRYPGFCRHRNHPLPDTAVRCQLEETQPFIFKDRFQGLQRQSVYDEGDVIVLRKDGLFAYQLAVVVDDAFQGVNQVIRGIDLLDATVRQHCLQMHLGYPQPVYGHFPVLVDDSGAKLSKQHGADALSLTDPAGTLVNALTMLQQQPPMELAESTPEEVLTWATDNWQPQALYGLSTLQQA